MGPSSGKTLDIPDACFTAIKKDKCCFLLPVWWWVQNCSRSISAQIAGIEGSSSELSKLFRNSRLNVDILMTFQNRRTRKSGNALAYVLRQLCGCIIPLKKRNMEMNRREAGDFWAGQKRVIPLEVWQSIFKVWMPISPQSWSLVSHGLCFLSCLCKLYSSNECTGWKHQVDAKLSLTDVSWCKSNTTL